MESQLLEGGSPRTVISAGTVFAVGTEQGITPLIIATENLGQIEALDASAAAKARITQAVKAGSVVIVPSRRVAVGETLTIAWYEIDPNTGDTIGVTEDGGHQAIAEFAARVAFSVLLIGTLQGTFIVLGNLVFNDDCMGSTASRKKCFTTIHFFSSQW